jgi:hypothetical protein
VRVLILTTYDTDVYVFEVLLAPRITRRLIAQFTAARAAHQASEDRLAELTQREREVLGWSAGDSATRRSPPS